MSYCLLVKGFMSFEIENFPCNKFTLPVLTCNFLVIKLNLHDLSLSFTKHKIVLWYTSSKEVVELHLEIFYNMTTRQKQNTRRFLKVHGVNLTLT